MQVKKMNNFLITILSLSASGSILALILFILKPLLKNKVSKVFSYYIWILVLLRLIVPYSAPVNMMDAPPEQTVSPTIENPGKVMEILVTTQQVPVFSSQQPNNTTDSTKVPMKPQRSLRSIIQDNLIWLWLAGTAIYFGWFFISYAIFSRYIRQSFTIPHGDDLDRFNRLIKDKRVRLFYSSYTTTPMLIGVLHPVIVLPHFAYVHNGKEKELKVILSHELIHYRRKDILYKWLVVMVTSLHWFNPFMIWIRKEIEQACELSCDEAVIRNMSEDEKHFYGNTLISLAAINKNYKCVLATTLCEDKKKLKERLLSIMKFKRKSVGGVALMLILTLLLVGCAATLGVSGVQETTQQTKEHTEINNYDDGEIGSDPANQTIVRQVTEQTTNKLDDVQKGSGSANDLLALKTQDRYEDGKIFTDVPEDFVNTFKDKVAALTIPDARKGERAIDIQQAEVIQDHAILFLDSIPEQNIYLYGYYNTDYQPGCGLILDIGLEQNVYLFPYRYMTNTMLSPDLSISSDGSKIYVNCHTGSGTGVAVSELYVFRVDNNQIEPYYIDINDLVNRLGEQISISYDSDYEKVTVSSDSKTILIDRLTSFIGANNNDNLSPSSFYCGDFIYFIQEGDSLKVNWNPVLYAKEQPGAQCYLYNLDTLEAELFFIYDSHGNITGFDIGEVTAA
ncbi:MAG TPA: hypothetical protein DDZ89_06400, partial [Clostridiales bacterium]|nr:hypothetical protein [Clostridiales bacterium]